MNKPAEEFLAVLIALAFLGLAAVTFFAFLTFRLNP